MIRNQLFLLLIVLSAVLQAQPRIEYFDATQTKKRSETEMKYGIPQGRYTEYYESGKINRTGFFNNGKEDSTWILFYETGAKKAIERFDNGKREGVFQYFYKSGKRAQWLHYNYDVADSVWTAWYENGKLKSREVWEKGRKNGDWEYYYESGQPESKGTFEKDKKQGLVQTYIVFDGTLSSWWTKIVVGALLFMFIVLQRLVFRAGPRRT